MARHKWITEDFYWKTFSVVLAVVVWLIVHNFSNEGATPGLLAVQDTYTNIPVLVVPATVDAQKVRVETNVVTVTVSGASDVMAALTSDNLHAIVDLNGIEAAHDLPCPVEVAVPPRVTLLNVDPPDVTVTISANK